MAIPGKVACDWPDVYVAHGFLDVAICRQLCQEAGQGVRSPATISTAAGDDIADDARRRTSQVDMPERAYAELIERFKAAAGDLEHRFAIGLPMLQRPQFLLYQRGDFFRPHQDSSDCPAHGRNLRARAISAVVFLNRQTRLPEPDAYCGGELRLFQDGGRPGPGVGIAGEPGLMVAFPSSMFHEVRPVTHGERHTVVTWYLDETAGAREGV